VAGLVRVGGRRVIAAPDRHADEAVSYEAPTGEGGPCVAKPRPEVDHEEAGVQRTGVCRDPDAPRFGVGAHIAYDAWREHLGGVLPTGHALPDLDELNPYVSDAWDQAGAAFLHAVSLTVTDAVQDGAADAVGEAFAHAIHHTRRPADAVGGVVLVPLRELGAAAARKGRARW